MTNYKKEIIAVMPSWKGPDLLKRTIPNFINSLSTDSELIVILNEADKESINICLDNKVKMIALDKNWGHLAVDFAIPLLKSEYVININSDMYFHKGWDNDLIEIIKENGNSSASCFNIEPVDTGSPFVFAENLGDFLDERTEQLFLENVKSGKYFKNRKKLYSFNHPIMVKTKDFLAVGGYSDNFDLDWFPGYGLDDDFMARLYNLHSDFKGICSDKSCVYHGISLTFKKVDPATRARNGWNVFQKKHGYSIPQFHHYMKRGKPL